ncbi:hypothetical protein [Streptomyces alfalfae]
MTGTRKQADHGSEPERGTRERQPKGAAGSVQSVDRAVSVLELSLIHN